MNKKQVKKGGTSSTAECVTPKRLMTQDGFLFRLTITKGAFLRGDPDPDPDHPKGTHSKQRYYS